MTTWVVDTSPLIFLAKLGRLELLRNSAATICVPRAVLAQVRAQPDEATLAIERASQTLRGLGRQLTVGQPL